MSTEATHTGVSNDQKPSRADILNDLAEQAHDPNLVHESGLPEGSNLMDEPEQAEDGDVATTDSTGADGSTDPDATGEAELVTIKVDGKDVQVPRDKIYEAGVRSLQKESTADERLQAAYRRRQELEQLEQRIKDQMAALQHQAEIDYGKEVVSKIFDNEEAAAQTINQLASKLDQTQRLITDMAAKEALLTADQQEQQAAAQAEAEAGIQEYFRSAHRDIAEDEDLLVVMVRQAAVVQAENPDLEPTKIVDQAAERVRDKFKLQPGPGRLPRQGTRAGGRKPPAPPPKIESTADAINAMRQARGQRPI
jgi:RNA polymerase-interacting CarD/CdnL/TRCF family regulator